MEFESNDCDIPHLQVGYHDKARQVTFLFLCNNISFYLPPFMNIIEDKLPVFVLPELKGGDFCFV